MNKPYKILSFLIVLGILIFISCAKQVAISGGPKDTKPPKFIKSTPQNGSIKFNFNKIYIQFDEYIRLNNLSQKLIISPPIKTKPDIRIKNKGILIKLKPEELNENTTYSLNFNDAIADNNENNSLNSFVFAFSTGQEIDSLSCSGNVLDAFTKKPLKDVWVSLYDNLSDSAIMTFQPSYITKTDQNGKFYIPYIKEKEYNIYAFTDNNYNYLFDLPEESIAFSDTTIKPGVKITNLSDSTKPKITFYPSNLELLVFKEDKQAQFIKSNKRLNSRLIELVFNKPEYSKFEIIIEGDENYLKTFSKNLDTVNIYISENEIINSENIKLICNYSAFYNTDSIKTDSLFFSKPDKILIQSEAKISIPSTKEPNKDLEIISEYPISEFSASKLKLELKTDEEYVETDFKLEKDSKNPLLLILKANFLEKSEYRILVDSSFITNIYAEYNLPDTIKIKTASSSEYGNLKITFPGNNLNYLVQILQNDKIIRENFEVDGNVEFELIKAGKYTIKLIEDLNNNKRWDTGDFNQRKQAEKVYVLPFEYEVRGNWTHEIEWDPLTNEIKD